MQIVAVDIGNSSTKIAIASSSTNSENEKPNWTFKTTVRGDDRFEFSDQTFTDQSVFWSVSSVNSTRLNSLQQWVTQNRPSDRFHAIGESDVHLESKVESRDQLGRDRLIGCWIAVQINQQKGPIIVVDAGTAVTIDLVDENLVHQGGHIYPGAETNFYQLARKTDALPDLSENFELEDLQYGAVGQSTDNAIRNGVLQSQIGSIRGIVEAVSVLQKSQPTVLITGGGIKPIRKFLPAQWIEIPDLILRGALAIGKRLSTAD